ncbi:MAG: hypothetical protein P4L50_10460 [Anaerolineaceae bacterium]|nr:hypothetical protein [Anaerolineaceae bacterium]
MTINIPAAPNGMLLDGQATAQTVKLFVVNPYSSFFRRASSISEQTVISSLKNYSLVKVQGMATDGAATAIAVYQLGLNRQVTFTGTDGTQFESWNSQFLNYPPSFGNCAGQCSITANPIQGSDGSYYAFALLLAPKQGNSVDYGPEIASIMASTGAEKGKSVYLNIVPTPVILVHGIWSSDAGMNTQLNDLNSAQPWEFGNNFYKTVTATCYASSIPFDATGDLSSGYCGQSSENALKKSISDVQSNMYKAGFVGGRIDIVAHSMGGLATRNYTATLDYTSSDSRARSRTLGPLRTIITIDTPETGSPLATALLTPAISQGTCALSSLDSSGTYTCDYGPFSGRAALTWRAACGPDIHTTLAQCLKMQSMPLGPLNPCTAPNQDASTATCGAVASLIPKSPNINHLPLIINIQNENVKWFAIESDWPDTGGDSSSLMRAFFNDLLAAMTLHSSMPAGLCPASNNPIPSPPTLLCLMENDSKSDVIVPTRSQSDDTNGNLVEYFNRAHSPMPFIARAYPALWGKSNANILDGAADLCIEHLLLTSSLQECSSVVTPQTETELRDYQPALQDLSVVETAPGESPGEARERALHPMRMQARHISVDVSSGDVPLGSSVRLVMHLPLGKVNTILYGESSGAEDLDTGDQGIARIVEDGGTTKTIEMTPLQLGALDVSVIALYADNSTGEQTVRLNVVPSAKGLKRFDLDQGFRTITLKLNEDVNDGQRWLVPTLTYSGVKYPIRLRDSSQIKFSIQQDASAPAISIDANGLIHALHTGTATITGDFAGMTDELQVSVETRP